MGGLAGVLGAGLYGAFPLAPLVGSRLSAVNSYVSELAVSGQPASGLFRGGDALAGALIVLLAVSVGRRAFRDQRVVIGTALLAAVGIASVFDAAHPMPCTPSTDASCRRVEDSPDLLIQLHQAHTISSVIGLTAGLTAMIVLGRASRGERGSRPGPAAPGSRPCHARGEAPWWPRWSGWSGGSWWSWGSQVAGCAVFVLGAVEIGLIVGEVGGVGALERAQVALLALWMAVLALRQLTGTPVRPDPPIMASTAHPGPRPPTRKNPAAATTAAGPSSMESRGCRPCPAPHPRNRGPGHREPRHRRRARLPGRRGDPA